MIAQVRACRTAREVMALLDDYWGRMGDEILAMYGAIAEHASVLDDEALAHLLAQSLTTARALARNPMLDRAALDRMLAGSADQVVAWSGSQPTQFHYLAAAQLSCAARAGLLTATASATNRLLEHVRALIATNPTWHTWSDNDHRSAVETLGEILSAVDDLPELELLPVLDAMGDCTIDTACQLVRRSQASRALWERVLVLVNDHPEVLAAIGAHSTLASDPASRAWYLARLAAVDARYDEGEVWVAEPLAEAYLAFARQSEGVECRRAFQRAMLLEPPVAVAGLARLSPTQRAALAPEDLQPAFEWDADTRLCALDALTTWDGAAGPNVETPITPAPATPSSSATPSPTRVRSRR